MNEMVQSHLELASSLAIASPSKLTNARPSRPLLIPDNNEPEFNLEYLRFAY